jgi:hypothetical protein
VHVRDARAIGCSQDDYTSLRWRFPSPPSHVRRSNVDRVGVGATTRNAPTCLNITETGSTCLAGFPQDQRRRRDVSSTDPVVACKPVTSASIMHVREGAVYTTQSVVSSIHASKRLLPQATDLNDAHISPTCGLSTSRQIQCYLANSAGLPALKREGNRAKQCSRWVIGVGPPAPRPSAEISAQAVLVLRSMSQLTSTSQEESNMEPQVALSGLGRVSASLLRK